MSHKHYLRKRINELQAQIDNKYGQVEALQKELKELKLKEFEEDLREEDERMLLKGQCCIRATLPKNNIQALDKVTIYCRMVTCKS